MTFSNVQQIKFIRKTRFIVKNAPSVSGVAIENITILKSKQKYRRSSTARNGVHTRISRIKGAFCRPLAEEGRGRWKNKNSRTAVWKIKSHLHGVALFHRERRTTSDEYRDLGKHFWRPFRRQLAETTATFPAPVVGNISRKFFQRGRRSS